MVHLTSVRVGLGRAEAVAALLGSLAFGACGHDPNAVCEAVSPDPPPLVDAELATLEGLGFDDFVDTSFAALMRRDPELATELGLSASLGLDDSQLTDISASYEAESARLNESILMRLTTFERATLDRQRQRTHDVYAWFLEDNARQSSVRDNDYPLTQLVGSVQNNVLLLLSDIHPVDSMKDANGFVNRLCQVDTKISQLVAAIDRAETHGVIPPRVVLDAIMPRVDSIADTAAREQSVYRVFSSKLRAPSDISQSEASTLRDRAADAIEVSLIPAYRRLGARLQRLARAAPDTVGVGQLPGGADLYAAALRHFTTTTLTAAELSAMGTAELQRIHAEMRVRFNTLGYPSNETLLQSFTRVAANGGSLSGPAIAAGYEALIAEATSRLGEAFAVLPQAPCVVVPVNRGGFYVGPSLDGSRPGAFYASTTGSVPQFGMPTLAYHETVPGHHLQIALALESTAPLARKVIGATAFIEGWALYAERLAAELHWYADDRYGNLGRLQMEAFRAARLVVDTGIHHDGWSFDRAHQFMIDNVGAPPGVINLEAEVARYVAWPGQATAYMTGMLELLRLRAEAQQQLGNRFDLMAFHTAILGAGSMPLGVLDAVVADYIADAP